MEQWNDADWVGTIRTFPINEEFVDDYDDYDERKKGTHWMDLE